MELQDGPGSVAIRVLNVGLLGVLVDGVVHLGGSRRSEVLVTNGLLVLAIEQDCQPTCPYGGGSNVLVKISSLKNGAINRESCGSLKLACSC